MASLTTLSEEKSLHFLFEAGIIIKGIIAIFELIAGVAVYFISPARLVAMVQYLTDHLLAGHFNFISAYALHAAQDFTVSSQYFAIIFLLGHGLIKIFMIVGLLREKLWYFPASVLVFTLFILYQLYRFMFTHSLILLAITIFDIVVVALTWHEYLRLKKERGLANPAT